MITKEEMESYKRQATRDGISVEEFMGHMGIEPDWTSAFDWHARKYGVHGTNPSPFNQLLKNAIEAWDKVIEDYKPTEDELVAEDQLRMFCERGGV